MNFEVPRFTVWPFRSHTIRSITRLSTEHKPLSNWADKVLNQQTHSSGNKLRHSALKYDVNLFQYRAFHYPWTTEDCNQIVLCNFKPRDKLFPMYSIFFFFFFLRPKTFNQTFFFFFFFSICRPPTAMQMTGTNSLYLQFVWFSITMQADKQGWNFETKNEISVAFNSEYHPNASWQNKSKENILVVLYIVDVSYFLSAMKHLWS